MVEFCTIFGGRTKSVRMPLMVSMGTLNLGGLSGTRTGLPEEAAKARDWLLVVAWSDSSVCVASLME